MAIGGWNDYKTTVVGDWVSGFEAEVEAIEPEVDESLLNWLDGK